MCVTPFYLPDGETLVGCRKCWQCQANRVNDLVGRGIAEKEIANHTIALTLTYRDDSPNAAVLVYADFQKFMKRLRKAGYSVRYIVAGEYGSKKGRAHWHAILFFEGEYPEIKLNSRVDWPLWRHGFVYAQTPDYGGFRYLLKYVLKEQGDKGSVNHLAMSKRPPLGHQYFINRAEQFVAQGLSPQNPGYKFADQFDKKGKRRRFWLQGRMMEIFIEHYLAVYKATHGNLYPWSQMLYDRERKVSDERREWDIDWKAYLARRSSLLQWRSDREQKKKEWTEVRGEYYKDVGLVIMAGSDLIVTRLDNGSLFVEKEGEPWHVETMLELDAVLDQLQTPAKHKEQIVSAICNGALQRGLPPLKRDDKN